MKAKRARAVAAVIGAGLLASQFTSIGMPAATAAADDLDLVSQGSGSPGINRGDPVRDFAISASGRYVVFNTESAFAASDTQYNDAYVRDRVNNTTTMASLKSDGGFMNASVRGRPEISGNGRVVGFSTDATNVDVNALGGNSVYVRDLDTGTTEFISRPTGTGSAGGGGHDSFVQSISEDGRYVAFSSTIRLDPADTDFAPDIYVRDRDNATTTLVSRATGADGADSFYGASVADMTPDGRYVVFETGGCLDPADTYDCAAGTSSPQDIYVRDLVTNTTTLASRANGADGAVGNDGDGEGGRPTISDDGRYVAFGSESNNLVAGSTYRNVVVRDLVDNVNILITRDIGEFGTPTNNENYTPFISGDGKRVAFVSRATNLSADDATTDRDIYVRDLRTFETALVSRASGGSGAKANAESEFPAMNRSGDAVAFASFATNLHTNDAEDAEDVFVRELSLILPAAAPTDITLSNEDIDENLPAGTNVGTLGVVDVNNEDTHTYALVEGEGDVANGDFEIDGTTLKTKVAFNHETQLLRPIRIRVTDSSGANYDETFLVGVMDVNEKPTSVSLKPNTVPEGQPAGTFVGLVKTVDPDFGDTHLYSLVPNTNPLKSENNTDFYIENGELRTTGAMSYAYDSERWITVRSSDANGLFLDRAFRVFLSASPTQTVSVSNVSKVEGTSSNGAKYWAFEFTVSRTNTTTAQTFALNVVAGTASVDGDVKLGQKSSLSFARGVSSKTVNIVVRADKLPEPDETFTVQALENGTVVATGTGTILNDDGPVTATKR